MSHRKSWFALVAVLFIGSISGCRAVDGGPSSFFGEDCQEDTDPASFGCIDIEGQISGTRGQPLPLIDVSVVAATAGGLSPDFALSDSEGHYQLRLLETANVSGTVTFSLKATVRTNAGDEISSQTIVVTAPVTLVGERPDPVTINFSLPVS